MGKSPNNYYFKQRLAFYIDMPWILNKVLHGKILDSEFMSCVCIEFEDEVFCFGLDNRCKRSFLRYVTNNSKNINHFAVKIMRQGAYYCMRLPCRGLTDT